MDQGRERTACETSMVKSRGELTEGGSGRILKTGDSRIRWVGKRQKKEKQRKDIIFPTIPLKSSAASKDALAALASLCRHFWSCFFSIIAVKSLRL